MAVKELTIADKLRQLYLLQSIDSKIDEIQVLKGELPIEVNDLEDEIAGLETRIGKIQTSIDGLDKEILNHRANITQSETLISRYEKQLDNVKNNREYDALTKEIEMQRLEIQLSEKKIKETTVLKSTKDESLATTQEKLDKRKSDLDTKKIELSEIISKTEKEEQMLSSQSDSARANIDERLLRSYDKIRKTYRNGLAVVTVERAACGGCFNLIPAQTIIEIGSMKDIIACEHCGRVLVDESIIQEVDA
ncbi:MAG TPA: C4-type zinc ribbon domain-containing protein [Saprospiraceae bacterium]|nr:C4-type zinc ribbon domain-containing protein [Saprospiraceae bacterium]